MPLVDGLLRKNAFEPRAQQAAGEGAFALIVGVLQDVAPREISRDPAIRTDRAEVASIVVIHGKGFSVRQVRSD